MQSNRQNTNVKSTTTEAQIIDQGLRSYMLKVYNYMASGVFLTGIVSLVLFRLSGGYDIQVSANGITGLTGIGQALFASPLMWVVMLAPLGIVFYMSFGIRKMSAAKAQTTFWIFASLMGASLASIFLVYDLIQLSILLYLTGGILNPFCFLLIIPSIVSSTFLSMGTTIILGVLTIIFLFLLTIVHYPLPGIHEHSITFPKLYLTGFFLAIMPNALHP